MYIIVAVLVVVIIIAGAAAYVLSNNGSSNNATPTPTPVPSVSVASATNLTFSANVTSQGVTIEYKWKGQDIHSGNLTLRLDFSTYAYIFNASAQKSWASTNSGATFKASTFLTDWGTTKVPAFGNQWADYVDNLAHWDGKSATYSYTDTAGEAIVIFNIVVNSAIPASTFTVA